MNAIVQDHHGAASSLRFDDIDAPEVPDDKVLVQVVAAGVDRGALHFMSGLPYAIRAVNDHAAVFAPTASMRPA